MDHFTLAGRIILGAVFAAGTFIKDIAGYVSGLFITAVRNGITFGLFMSLVFGVLLVSARIFAYRFNSKKQKPLNNTRPV
jgi:hypothetical protein